MKNINYLIIRSIRNQKKKERYLEYKESNLTNQRERLKDYKRVALFATICIKCLIESVKGWNLNIIEANEKSVSSVAGSSSHAMTVCIPTRGADSEIQGCVDELIVSQSRCHSLETCGQRCDLR